MRVRVRPLADGWGQRLSPVTVAVAIGALLVAQVAALLTVSSGAPARTAETPVIEDLIAAPSEPVTEAEQSPDKPNATEPKGVEAAESVEVPEASADATSGDDSSSGQGEETASAPPIPVVTVIPRPHGERRRPPLRRAAHRTRLANASRAGSPIRRGRRRTPAATRPPHTGRSSSG